MKKNLIYTLLALMVFVTSCDFLDHEPDMRASINTKEKVQLLLVSAYTVANPAPICEFSSDNIIDNNAPNAVGYSYSLNPLDQMYNEIFAWEPVKSSDQQDSPKYIWDGCYSAIAAANQALLAIKKLEAEGINMDAEKGEALLCRAYHHFLLAGVFCHAWKNEEESKKDLGITYMYQPETRVAPEYSRGPEIEVNETQDGDTLWVGGSLYHTYMAIEKDLEEGLKLVSDEYYSVPRYHFNVKAAHAFAARFYLYKREWAKVVEHADYVLGTSDETIVNNLFDAQKARDLGDPEQELRQVWLDTNAPFNLLVYITMSSAPYTLIPSYGRYQYNGAVSNAVTLGSGPCWSSQWPGWAQWMYDQAYGTFCAKFMAMFEYTDKVNGYGYIHAATRAFTTNETLLCRAEAKLYLGDTPGAINDLKLWAAGYNVGGKMQLDKMTYNMISAFYSTASPHLTQKLNTELISPDFVVTAEQLPIVYCLLHFRRIETLHDGLRWQDIKRYGIEIEHVQGKDAPRKLVWNDDRRAIQLPNEVVMAGMTANPREVLGDASSSSMVPVGPASTPNEQTQIMPDVNKSLGAGKPILREVED